MEEFDVIIVGAGPAGSSCAIECADHGLKVALIEKLDHPRVKVCGGGVVQRAYDACPIDISSVVEKQISSINLGWDRSKLLVNAKQDKPIIYMVQRKHLDKLLFDAALEAGVHYFPNTTLQSIEQDKHVVKVVLSDHRTIVGTWLVGADGASGSTAKLAGWQKIKKIQSPAIDAEVVLREPVASSLQQTRFDFDVVKYGYGWVFPKGDHFSIGLGIFQSLTNHKNSTSLPKLLDEYLAFLGIKAEDIISIKKKGFVIPTNYVNEGAVKGRVMLVGDAAGLADPLTAEGISAALISGKFAAQALLKAASENVDAAQLYQQKLQDELLIDLHMSQKLSKLLYKYTGITKLILRTRPTKATHAISKIFTGEARFSHLSRNASLLRRSFLRLLG